MKTPSLCRRAAAPQETPGRRPRNVVRALWPSGFEPSKYASAQPTAWRGLASTCRSVPKGSARSAHPVSHRPEPRRTARIRRVLAITWQRVVGSRSISDAANGNPGGIRPAVPPPSRDGPCGDVFGVQQHHLGPDRLLRPASPDDLRCCIRSARSDRGLPRRRSSLPALRSTDLRVHSRAGLAWTTRLLAFPPTRQQSPRPHSPSSSIGRSSTCIR